MPVPAAALRELHRIHLQLEDLRERADRGPKQIRARDTNLARLTDELAKVQAEGKAARVRADQKQLLLKSGEEKIANLRGKLNQCTTNREYQALKDQIAADEMANSVLSDEILEALEKIDEQQKLLHEAQQRIVAAKEELAKVQQAVAEQSQLLQTDIQRLQAELATAETALPGDIAGEYQRMVRARSADAMAEVQGEFCGGCCKQLTPNILSELTLGQAVICKNCGRLIYLPEDRQPGRR
jgi:hypothetical protein